MRKCHIIIDTAWTHNFEFKFLFASPLFGCVVIATFQIHLNHKYWTIIMIKTCLYQRLVYCVHLYTTTEKTQHVQSCIFIIPILLLCRCRWFIKYTCRLSHRAYVAKRVLIVSDWRSRHLKKKSVYNILSEMGSRQLVHFFFECSNVWRVCPSIGDTVSQMII